MFLKRIQKTGMLLLLAATLAGTAYSRPGMRYPKAEARNTTILTVDSLLQRASGARLYVTLSYPSGGWMALSDSFYIEQPETGGRWRCLDIDGVDFGRKFVFPESGRMSVEIDFPPMNRSDLPFDLLYTGENPAWRVVGLSDRISGRKPKSVGLPRERAVSPDSTCLRGRLSGYHPRLDFSPARIYLEHPFSGKRSEIAVPLDADGCFSVVLPAEYPVQQTLYFPAGYLQVYLEPGETTTVTASLEELARPVRFPEETERQARHIRYRGRPGAVNRQLRDWRVATDSLYRVRMPQMQWDPERFETALQQLDESVARIFAVRRKRFSPAVRRMIELDRAYRSGAARLAYRLRRKDTPVAPTLIQALPLDDPASLSVGSYHLFLELLESLLAVRAGRPDTERLLQAFEKAGVRLDTAELQLVRFSAGMESASDTASFPEFRRQMERFNRKYAAQQLLVREQLMDDYFDTRWQALCGTAGSFTRELLETRRFPGRLKRIGRPLTPEEFDRCTANIRQPQLRAWMEQVNGGLWDD